MREHELQEHERRIEQALARAASRLHVPIERSTPESELILSEEAEAFEQMADAEERGQRLLMAFFTKFFDFLYEDGPHPGWVLRRLYVLARRYRPELILEMNGTDLGLMFGETRASQSYRMQQIFDRLKLSGVRGFRGGGCKTESAREAYAESAEGNHNRAGKRKKKKK
jgi:hypothetical protein